MVKITQRICEITKMSLTWIRIPYVKNNDFHKNNWVKFHVLTEWHRVRHICVDKLAIIGSDIGLLPGQNQAIIWTNAGILLIISRDHTSMKLHFNLRESISKYSLENGGHLAQP